MVRIIFETHSTTTDNEAGVASGKHDPPLSALGEQQAGELGRRRGSEHFDAIYCSMQQRTWRTANIAFGQRGIPIIRDERLNECDYGNWNGQSEEAVRSARSEHIQLPFPGGESYQQTTERMWSFLQDLSANYQGKCVLIIGHRATQYGLEHLINGIPLAAVVTAPWKWQPGWEFTLSPISRQVGGK